MLWRPNMLDLGVRDLGDEEVAMRLRRMAS